MGRQKSPDFVTTIQSEEAVLAGYQTLLDKHRGGAGGVTGDTQHFSLARVSSRRLERLITRKANTKMKTPEAFAPGAFRMSLQLTGSPSPFSIGWGGEFPRFLHPVVLLPAPGSRVSSCPKLFGSHRIRFSGCPKAPLRRSPPDASSGYPDSYIFRLACGESPGRPGPSLRLRRLPPNLQVSLAVVPSSSTGRSIFRSPRISSSGVAANASPDFPGSCVHGWVDGEPGQPELCTLQRSWRMNLRVQSASHIPPALDAFPTSLRLSTCRTSRLVKRRSETESASSCRNRTAFPIPYRFTNWEQSLGLFEL